MHEEKSNGSWQTVARQLQQRKRLALRITPAAERAVRSGHPWLFAEGITKQSHNGRSGDLVVIFDRKNRFLAVGLYDPASPIRVRILQQGEAATVDGGWFGERVETAVSHRTPHFNDQTTAYRLIHGENDGLPGLVVDKYDQTFVIKLYTAAWVPHLEPVIGQLEAMNPERIVLRLSRAVQDDHAALHGLRDGQHLLGRPTDAVRFLENGLWFEADVVRGQKTGFFLDQRENRARLEELTAGKSVLNVFAYTGGFSLYAARGGAVRVVSLDLSQPALATAVRNFKLNQHHTNVANAEHELLLGDAFRAMTQLADGRQRFDVVVIDPPAFAKRQSEVAGALSSYGRLARLGVRLLRPGGQLITASCSSRVTATDFFQAVEQGVAAENCILGEVAHTFHAVDHPIGFPEGAYLKCLWARVR
ncbi:MAG: class I SAM-dependent methyltransferase [Anaerolineales bacterium]|nr:class I SAM-dependent methyltransferase [Anaerolineales bacterium]